MKKLFTVLFSVSFCFLLTACIKNLSPINNTKPSFSETILATTKETFLQVSETEAVKNTAEIGQGGGELLPRKYRNNYYQVPAFFASLVDKNKFIEWESEYYSANNPDKTNVMVMVAFIKEFNISKEEFERANLEYAKFIYGVYSQVCLNPKDYADQEMHEIYNTEIIYTFDNDTINEYYLGSEYAFLNEYEYDEALANGTYQTRTTEWVDVEAMEAEIIAKYGEAEITEDVTRTQEESTVPEETEIQTETAA